MASIYRKQNSPFWFIQFIDADGTRRIATETGAGQWGSALSFACAQFDIECKVYMVRVSYNQKPYRRALMETYGAECVPSPSNETASGRAILAQFSPAERKSVLGKVKFEPYQPSTPMSIAAVEAE